MRAIVYLLCILLPAISFVAVFFSAWLIGCVINVWVESWDNTLSNTKVGPYYGSYKDGFPHLGDKFENIFWFVQISDIHISQFRDFGQVNDLKSFCTDYMTIIKPSLLLITGDMVDAKDISNLGSRQYEDEWKTYSAVVQLCQSSLRIPWLDVRGNHDAFQVPNQASSGNMYKNYGVSQELRGSSGSYQYVHQAGFGRYAFNALDLSPDPGFGRPFNFFGVPESGELEELSQMPSDSFNMSVWFGHYPLSVTTQPHALRKLLSSGVVYVCGHLHTLLGAFPQMHTVHREGFLELENGDWKENRRFRLMAIDHDIFSFRDLEYPAFPIVLITNPKDSRYLAPGREALSRASTSSHVRFLVFSDAPVVSTIVKINDEIICRSANVSEGPLHTCEWQASRYHQGQHLIAVSIVDAAGKTSSSKHYFSLDGSRAKLSARSMILLLTDFSSLARMIFVFCVVVFVFVPLMLRRTDFHQVRLFREFLSSVVPQIPLFVDNDTLFWPVFCFSIYLCVAPLSVGYFAPDSVGIAFSHGIYSHGTFIPEPLLYLHTSAHFILFNGIIIIYLGEVIRPHSDLFSASWLRKSCWKVLRAIFFHAMFIFLVWLLASSARMFWIAYGKLAFLMNPFKLWSIGLVLYLFYKACLMAAVT